VISPKLVYLNSLSQLLARLAIFIYGFAGGVVGFLLGFIPLMTRILHRDAESHRHEQHIL
jgi:hypothetical protein